jgi:AcrR family transcriptional regulator
MADLGRKQTSRLRRVPQQSRSRDRVKKILDTAAEQVVLHGVEGLGTRGIADAAGVPVASLYQYFADKDDILLALVERDLAALEAMAREQVAALPRPSIAAFVEASLAAYIEVYRERPAFVVIWLRGRTNPAVREYCVEYNRKVGEALYELASSLRLLAVEADTRHAQIAVEVADRLFEKAFESDLEGDPLILDEARKVVTAYLELYAAPEGRGTRKETAGVGAQRTAPPKQRR